MAAVSTGLTISGSTGFLAEILDVQGPGASREAIPTSHMGTTNAHTFTPADLVDWGEMTVEIAFAPGTAPPVNAVAETWIITYPNAAAGTNTWSFSGFMTGFSPGAPLEQRMTGSATIKVTGAVTVA